MSVNRLVLVINASYEPINVCSARNAIKLVCKGAAVVEKPSQHVLHTASMSVPVPYVIRLQRYRRVPRLNRSVSRKGIILRDGNACQYCGAKKLSKDLTMDHVHPKSRGGPPSWENLVACCWPCNNRKGNRTPHEAGMALIKPPKQLGLHYKHKLLAGDSLEAWRPYLFV